MSITQEDLTTQVEQQDAAAYFQARRDLAFQIIAANSKQFFEGSDQGAPNQHMSVRKFTDKAFSIAEEALLSEKTIQFKG